MAFTSWRGVVGVVKPTMRPGSLEEFIRLIPEGIGVIPVFLNIHEGTTSEFESVMPVIEAKVAECRSGRLRNWLALASLMEHSGGSLDRGVEQPGSSSGS